MPICPICRQLLEEELTVLYKDFLCRSSRWHFFGERSDREMLIARKVRVRDAFGGMLCLKLHYDRGYCEVWTGSDRVKRLLVPFLVEVDLSSEKSIRQIILFWLKRERLLRRVSWRVLPIGQ